MEQISRRPILDNHEKVFLKHLKDVGEKYGYVLHPDPRDRTKMPIEMLYELGFEFAAQEFKYAK